MREATVTHDLMTARRPEGRFSALQESPEDGSEEESDTMNMSSDEDEDMGSLTLDN